MEELISIVVPVYNVEKYIEKCIKSIQVQTYKNLQIILVDDGTKDNSGKICDEYAKNDNRIEVIHKQNGGLSDARNNGIEKAQGKYIAFVDSDDYIEPNYIELLYKTVKKYNVQISQCGIKKVNEKEEVIQKISYEQEEIKDSKQVIRELYLGRWENSVTWNKLYLTSLFSEIKFPKGKIHEDEFTTYKLIYNVKKIGAIPNCLYNYRQNTNSITGSKYNIKRLDRLEAFYERLEFFKNKNEIELYNLSLYALLRDIRENYIKIKKYINENKTLQKKLISDYRKIYKKAIKIKQISKIKKIKETAFYIAPNLWYIIKKNSY